MSIIINNISLGIDEEMDLLKKKTCKVVRLNEDQVMSFKILRESIDARKKENIKFNYSIEIQCDNEKKLVDKLKDPNVKLQEESYQGDFPLGHTKMDHRPVIVGMGPAGMFAGLLMAQKGYRPIIIERGQNVEERTETVKSFWQGKALNTESNVQFGEGGAGTFSDGKLTTRIKDNRCDYVLQEFVEAGAPEEIIYSGKPHIGTDILKEVVKNIRNRIIMLGGEVRFNSKLQDLVIKNGKLFSIIVNNEEIPCEVLLLSIGHSSRDTYEMLLKRNIYMEPKAFAIGVRVEHPQDMIDISQYGKYAGHKRLKSADYRLTYTSQKLNRSVYSFCMCPGGVVVAAASEEEKLVTNGMSYYDRNGTNANSAIVVSVGEKDFNGASPLKGMEFQRHYEALAYNSTKEKYFAPVQLLGDFMKDNVSTKLGSIIPTYAPGYEFVDLRNTLPGYVVQGIKEGITTFDRKIKGFAREDAIITGIETRTSAPVRIIRNEKLQSTSVSGLYPAGEGAGYAGGIISSAVDGLKVAESIMKEYSNLK